MRLKIIYPAIFIMAIGLCGVLFYFSYDKSPSAIQPENKNEKSFSDLSAEGSPKAEANQIDPNKQTEWSHPRSNERLTDHQQMVQTIRGRYGFDNQQVLAAMLNVPRHWFVPASFQAMAYEDTPLPIGHGQTISQPFIVAYMTGLLDLTPQMKVLEIGTGSGYQAAVLSEFTPYVYTIEILEPLAKKAQEQLSNHGYNTIKVRIGDGYKGWPQYAPFDAIIVTCAPDHIPQPLIDQLKSGGKIVIPVGRYAQDLLLVTKRADGSLEKKSMMPVRFVPLLRKKTE
jgi:protein-L-isoaspartate(D-aspartate) O-methyltransferase